MYYCNMYYYYYISYISWHRLVSHKQCFQWPWPFYLGLWPWTSTVCNIEYLCKFPPYNSYKTWTTHTDRKLEWSMITVNFNVILLTLTLCNLGLWPYYDIILPLLYIYYELSCEFFSILGALCCFLSMFAKSMNILPKFIWRLFCKWPWPPITLTFAIIIKDSYFAAFFWVTCLIPFTLRPNMPCFMVVFKMTLIFADFLAAILEIT